jgi:putative transposase
VSDANVVKLLQPGSFADPLTEVLRNGARALLAQAIEAEVADFLAKHIDLKTATGLRRVVRHGHLPEREVMTGIGATVGLPMMPGVSASRRRSCRPTRGAPAAWRC